MSETIDGFGGGEEREMGIGLAGFVDGFEAVGGSGGGGEGSEF